MHLGRPDRGRSSVLPVAWKRSRRRWMTACFTLSRLTISLPEIPSWCHPTARLLFSFDSLRLGGTLVCTLFSHHIHTIFSKQKLSSVANGYCLHVHYVEFIQLFCFVSWKRWKIPRILGKFGWFWQVREKCNRIAMSTKPLLHLVQCSRSWSKPFYTHTHTHTHTINEIVTIH